MPSPHIAYVIETLEVGGAERIVVDCARAMRRRGWAVDVVCLRSPGQLAEELTASGVQVHSMGKKGAVDLAMLRRLVRLLKRLAVDVVHTHLFTANTWGRLAARFGGAPVVVATEHNLDIWKGAVHRTVDRWLYRSTSRLVTVSDDVAAFYRRSERLDEARMQTIHNGIDVDDPGYTAEARREFHIHSSDPLFVCVGRLVEAKGHGDLLDAFAAAHRRRGDLRLLIVGDGPLADELHHRADLLGLHDSVIFTGTRTDCARLMAASDALTMASLREGLPMVILEASALGLPMIVTDVGGNREVVEDGFNGFLLPPRRPGAMTDAMLRIADDDELRRRLGHNARRRHHEAFSLTSMVDAHERLYRELLNGGGGRLVA